MFSSFSSFLESRPYPEYISQRVSPDCYTFRVPTFLYITFNGFLPQIPEFLSRNCFLNIVRSLQNFGVHSLIITPTVGAVIIIIMQCSHNYNNYDCNNNQNLLFFNDRRIYYKLNVLFLQYQILTHFFRVEFKLNYITIL